MKPDRPRVIVIGAGIIGSAIAYNLSIRGADVMLLEEGPKPGSGVTGHAFGWINVINGTPGDASYLLWREALTEYRHLKAALPDAFIDARAGSLFWWATAEETAQFAEIHRNAGENVELVKGSVLAEWEPRLRNVPDHAVFSPDDIALSPAQLAATFVAKAAAAGASVRFETRITGIETANGRVRAVRTGGDLLDADIVVMAAGAGVPGLTRALGIETGLATSPALLLRYACSRPLISRILRGPRLEIRQADDNTLFVAKSWIEDGTENGPRMIGERTLAVMKDELDLPDDVTLAGADVGNRPVFADGLPRFGFLDRLEGLYIAAGHPGVILAPLLGRLAAEEICDGRRTNLLPAPSTMAS